MEENANERQKVDLIINRRVLEDAKHLFKEYQVDSLRNECEAEVRRTNDEFNLKDAIRWQRG